MPSSSVKDYQEQLSEILSQAEVWAHRFSALSDVPEPGAAWKCVEELRRLRTRTASTLIKIAVLGAFSSGKSTLVSALSGKLEVIQVNDLDGNPAEKVVGILPIAPAPASACPARVVPVSGDAQMDASGRGFLRVRFADSPDWEDIAANPDSKLVAAYTARSADQGKREEGHRGRDVAEAEILLSDSEIPAMLYDLPGYGAPEDPYEAVIEAAIHDADCFIYVTRANRSLAEEDLALLNSLYDSSRGRRVIWVLTGVDEANQVDEDLIPNSRKIKEQNDDYLAGWFKGINDRPDAAFIGDGFREVSPVAEARAKGSGEPDVRMEKLRQAIREMIEAESGRKHVAAVALEAREAILPLVRKVSLRWMNAWERLDPVEVEAEALAIKRDRLVQINNALDAAPSELKEILAGRAKQASRPFGGLADHLHDCLDSVIEGTDLRDARKANRVAVTGTQVLRSWAEASDGPGRLWDQGLEAFRNDIIDWVENRLELAIDSSSPRGARFDIESLNFDIANTYAEAQSGILAPVAAAVSVSGSFATLVSYSVLPAGAAAAFPPAGAIAALVGLTAMGVEIFRRRKKGAPTGEMRNDWLSQLDKMPGIFQKQFEDSFRDRGEWMIARLEEELEERKSRLHSSIAAVEEKNEARTDGPERQRSQDLVEMLGPVVHSGRRLVSDLGELRDQCRLGP